jgi:hypothetical protein
VGFHDVFDDAQADPNPLGRAAQFGTAAIKALEDFCMLFFWNTFAVVGNP